MSQLPQNHGHARRGGGARGSVSVRWKSQKPRPQTSARHRSGTAVLVSASSSGAAGRAHSPHAHDRSQHPHRGAGGGGTHTPAGTAPRRRKLRPQNAAVVQKIKVRKAVPTTSAGVLESLVVQLTTFVDDKRKELDTLAHASKAKRKHLDLLVHQMRGLMGQSEALGLKSHSDVVASRELLEIVMDKEETLGMKFPLAWRDNSSGSSNNNQAPPAGGGGTGKGGSGRTGGAGGNASSCSGGGGGGGGGGGIDSRRRPGRPARRAASPTTNNFTVNKSISRKTVYARGTDIDELQATLEQHHADAKIMAHSVKQYQHMQDRLYNLNLRLKRSTAKLDEYIVKMKSKDRQLSRAIETEEHKRALEHHRFRDAERARQKRVAAKRAELKNAEVAVAASNNMHMLIVSQAQLKKNVELKMAGDMDEADERRLNKKFTKSLIVQKLQQLKHQDDAAMEAKFHKALHALGLKGTIEDTDCDEVIAIVQRQHEVAVELEQKKQSLSAHIAALHHQIADAKQQIEDAMYGTSDYAAQELHELDERLAADNEELRDTREATAAQTAVVSDMRFALNTIILDFLGVDCAVHSDTEVIDKLVTKVLNRLAALVKFGASLLAADKTPIRNVVEEATLATANAAVTVDQHFAGRRSRSPSPTPIPAGTTRATKDKNVRVRTDAALEGAQDEAVRRQAAAAAQAHAAAKRAARKVTSKATSGLLDGSDDSDDSDGADALLSRRQLKLAAVKLVEAADPQGHHPHPRRHHPHPSAQPHHGGVGAGSGGGGRGNKAVQFDDYAGVVMSRGEAGDGGTAPAGDGSGGGGGGGSGRGGVAAGEGGQRGSSQRAAVSPNHL